MNKNLLKTVSVILALSFCLSLLGAAAAEEVDYTISNPYESVADLLGNDEAHYRTNLHTHSTVSDASTDFADMIKASYDEGFDILGFSEHGVIGKEWNKKPTQVPLYLYQYLAGNKVTHLTDEEYEAITGGTYPSETRTNGRGMQCVPTGIELNMLTISKSHVNSYFSDWGNNDIGFENGFEYAVYHVDKKGGISFINHPGDWTRSGDQFSISKDPDNVRLFGEIFKKYDSCLGMEIFNDRDIAPQDRARWDKILQYVIPNGERNVWAFANNDAHTPSVIDSSFMDFILPEYSIDNVRECMENGTFFAIGRYAKPELGSDFRGTGPYPIVTSIAVDEENDTITVSAKNAQKLQWIANGEIIEETEAENGVVTSVIKLREHSDKITCYVRFQVIGEGGLLCSQAFVCDDGDMARFIINDERTDFQKFIDAIIYFFRSLRISVIFDRIFDKNL